MKTTKPSCIVIDTNVLISAGLLPNSRTAEVLEIAAGHFEIAQNTKTWYELETRIARAKFDRYFAPDGRSKHLTEIASSVRYFPIVSSEAACRDPDDDKFINLAIDAGAKLIVSGDLDLLAIGTYKGIEIISAAQFLERMQSSEDRAPTSDPTR